MKITELILQLHQEMLARGNVDVWTYRIDGSSEPDVEWIDLQGFGPAGIYIS